MTTIVIISLALLAVMTFLCCRMGRINCKLNHRLRLEEFNHREDMNDLMYNRPISFSFCVGERSCNVYCVKEYGTDMENYNIKRNYRMMALKVISIPFDPADETAKTYAKNQAEEIVRLLDETL